MDLKHSNVLVSKMTSYHNSCWQKYHICKYEKIIILHYRSIILVPISYQRKTEGNCSTKCFEGTRTTTITDCTGYSESTFKCKHQYETKPCGPIYDDRCDGKYIRIVFHTNQFHITNIRSSFGFEYSFFSYRIARRMDFLVILFYDMPRFRNVTSI